MIRKIMLCALFLLCALPLNAAIFGVGSVSGGFTGSSILPLNDDEYDLGSSETRWSDGFFAGALTANEITITGAGKTVLADGLVVNDSQGRYPVADFRVATYDTASALTVDSYAETFTINIPTTMAGANTVSGATTVTGSLVTGGGYGFDGDGKISQQQSGYVDVANTAHTIVQRADVTNSVGTMKIYSYSSESLADDASFNLPTAYGVGVAAIGTQATTFLIAADGSVVLTGKTADFEATDSDTDACIFDGGTYATVRNRLGTAQKVRVMFFYN